MTTIDRDGDAFIVPAALLAEGFGVKEEDVQREMREGRITSRTERGEGADEGRWRLTFHRGNRAIRFIIDDSGTILTRAGFPIRTARRSGGD